MLSERINRLADTITSSGAGGMSIPENIDIITEHLRLMARLATSMEQELEVHRLGERQRMAAAARQERAARTDALRAALEAADSNVRLLPVIPRPVPAWSPWRVRGTHHEEG